MIMIKRELELYARRLGEATADDHKLYPSGQYCDVLLPGNVAQKWTSHPILRYRELGGTQ